MSMLAFAEADPPLLVAGVMEATYIITSPMFSCFSSIDAVCCVLSLNSSPKRS